MTAAPLRVPRPREVARLFVLASRDERDGSRELYLTTVTGDGTQSWERHEGSAVRMSRAGAMSLAWWLGVGDDVYLKEVW